MQWILDNWILTLLIVAMLAMHLTGHCGGKGHKKKGDSQRGEDGDAKLREATAPRDRKADETAQRDEPEV